MPPKLLFVIIATSFVHNSIGFGISSFGRAYTEPPKLTTTTQAPARPCSKQAECAGITSSSCVRTHYDPVTRCLCGDNLPPVNGQCEAPTKTLYHVCANSDECNDGLICGAPNITNAAPAHMRVFTPQDKICLCDTENGYKEKEHACNDAVILKISLFAIIFVSCLRKLIL
ncbi:uncharacterized protein LOC123715590 isoform X3 [Pieris brassicae]|uniref:uncharacterized protein LOC123715590 isoform X3 n=1 Tax=Pieris brassicae TaxID=7116 RepID=UPI001E65E64F|nr:uncharacterized protein LOC123715590 isoform X3 [Pieris brassicae]